MSSLGLAAAEVMRTASGARLRSRAIPSLYVGTVAQTTERGPHMTNRTYRVTEIVGTSPEGLEQAIHNGVERAAKTLRHCDWFELTEVRGQITDGKVSHFQVGLKIGFRLEDEE